MDTANVRPAADHDLPDIADLRWQWTLENDGTPATDHESFVRDFIAWARTNALTHECVVATRGDTVIGMAWLAVFARVPTPTNLLRATGDVQSVFVVPEERAAGLGSRMVDALLDRAVERGVERVTVHSSTRAIPVYERRGFGYAKRLLEVEVENLPRRREIDGASPPDHR